MPAKLIYHEVLPITRQKANKVFRADNPEEIVNTLLSVAYHDSDWRWAQEKCIELTNHPNPNVRGIAALCFGHIARVHNQLDLKIVLPIVNRLLKDKDKHVSQWAGDALDDIKHFLKRRYRYLVKKNPEVADARNKPKAT